MTEFAHAVNFTMSFGVTVLPEDINKLRKQLDESLHDLSLFDVVIDANSSDEELANYLGLENYRDWMLSECVDMEMEDHHVYDAKDTKRLTDEYKRKLEDFKKANATRGVDGQ
jgi:hypothetical protein